MKLLYKIFRLNPETRQGVISATSILGILVNLVIAVIKLMIGILASSIAIISEGVNNATDALTSTLTLVGTRLSGKHPDKKHPFGYGRIEYLTSLVIAVLILVTGTEMVIGSIRRIVEPGDLNISVLSLLIVAFSAAAKWLLGQYTIRQGKRMDSDALIGVGTESRNDSFVSVVTIVSVLVFLLFRFSIDAYAGIITSLLIIRSGIEVLRETLSKLIGQPGDETLARNIYREIRSTPGVLNAADLMLHNYGPEFYSGSVNVEIDHSRTIEEAYRELHALQLKIMHEYKVVMVFGIYAVDNDHEEVRRLRSQIADFIRSNTHVISYHALYLEPDTNRVYVDLVVDYDLRDWDTLRSDFTEYMNKCCPGRDLELTIETEYV